MNLATGFKGLSESQGLFSVIPWQSRVSTSTKWREVESLTEVQGVGGWAWLLDKRLFPSWSLYRGLHPEANWVCLVLHPEGKECAWTYQISGTWEQHRNLNNRVQDRDGQPVWCKDIQQQDVSKPCRSYSPKGTCRLIISLLSSLCCFSRWSMKNASSTVSLRG